jgi:hypothetical protein
MANGKWQMANGKWQMANGYGFAICNIEAISMALPFAISKDLLHLLTLAITKDLLHLLTLAITSESINAIMGSSFDMANGKWLWLRHLPFA